MLYTAIIMLMDNLIVYLSLIIVGLVMGSFAGASVWRLRARQLEQDKKSGEKVDHDEYKILHKLTKPSLHKDRSVCLHCSYRLRWYDLVPLVSWLILLGRCRKCKTKIGYMEPLIELGMALFFVASYMFWPFDLNDAINIMQFALWLVSGVGLAILFVYDLKWLLLPDMVNFAIIGIGLINSGLVIANSTDVVNSIYGIIGSILILSGLYWFLYVISQGKWIGFGDIKLGLGLGLLLADWKLAFVALFAANMVGCVIVLPAMLMGRLKRDSHVPFGPLLIAGYVIAGLAGGYIISIYASYLI
jgi:leader peptidase (prepilin peptidase)/N-methyltransferase